MSKTVKIIIIIAAVLLLLGGAGFIVAGARKKKNNEPKVDIRDKEKDLEETIDPIKKEKHLAGLMDLKTEYEGELKDRSAKLASNKYGVFNAERYYAQIPTPKDALDKLVKAREFQAGLESDVKAYKDAIEEVEKEIRLLK